MVISLPALVAVGNPALLAWGYNNAGQLGDGTTVNGSTPEINAVNVATAAVGSLHSLFLTADGTLWAMGLNNVGQLGNGTQSNNPNPTPITVASNVVAAAAGASDSLFVKSDGTLWATGVNNYGQLGDGTMANRSSAVAVIGGTNVVAAAAGGAHSLFLKSDGTLWAMGRNIYGQLGNGTTGGNYSTPVNVASNVVAIAAGQNHSLFVTTDGKLWGMGLNSSGQLGDGTMVNTNLPEILGSNTVALAAGSLHSLFVKSDDTLWAMGLNSNGQLGDGTTVTRTDPVQVVGGTNVMAVAAGQYHSLFVTMDGTQWAMGYKNYGQLGSGTSISTNQPVLVTNFLMSLSFANVASGSSANHSLAIGRPLPQASPAATQAAMPVAPTNATLNGMTLPYGLPTTAWFEWGPLGSYTQTTTPVDVGSGYNVVQVSSLINGLNSSTVYQCRLVASNSMGINTGAVKWFRVDQAPRVAGWGCIATAILVYGQAQPPPTLSNVVAVAGGAFHSLALLANGSVRAWGDNTHGQCTVPPAATNVVALGTGYGWNPYINLALRSDGTVVPWGQGAVVPGGLRNVVAVAAGDSHCLVVLANGHVLSWLNSPYTDYGQANVPAGLTNVVAVGGGSGHSLVLKADGTVIAWGENGDGQTNVPPSATNVVAIAAGSFHNLALRADGTVVAWGDNFYSESTVPPDLSNVVAIAAGGFHSLALKGDGTVVGWGAANNHYYCLGQATVPQGLSNVVNIACGGFHSLALGGNVPPTFNSQTNSGFENQDVVVAPVVFDANNDVFNSRVASLPAQGALYQYAGGARGPQITAPDTPITDVLDRVVFAPEPNNDGDPYTMFGLVANDGQADSAPGTMTINVFRAPQNFAAQNLGAGFQLQLAGTPNYPYILQMATNLTPPVVWQSILTNPADGNGNWDWSMTNLPANPAGFYRAVVQ